MDNRRKKEERVKVFVDGKELDKKTVTQEQLDAIVKWKMEAQGIFNLRNMVKT